MKDLLSRYRPRFLRSLVYMLQASEYSVREYLAWYHRTTDFAHVEKRKTIRWTLKAKVIYAYSWVFAVVWAVGLMSYANYTGSDVPLVVLAGVVVLTPFYFPYILALSMIVLQVLQKPVERYLVARAKQRLQAHPALKIAIAGSFGKTSMREILKCTLAEGKRVAAPGGSYNTPLGIAQFVHSLKGDEEILIFELGEYFQGDVRELCEIVQPAMGIITGVNEAHLEKFKDLDTTAQTIFELAEYLGDKPLYVNGESATARARARGGILYSRTGAGEWIVEGARTSLEGTTFTLVKGHTRVDVASKLLGLHMVGPMVAAAEIASKLGLSPREIRTGLMNTTPFAHRLEPRFDQGVVTLDDSYNGNPDGVTAVIEFIKLIPRRRWYVTPGLVEMGKRSEEVHRQIGSQLAAAGIEKIVLIRDSVTPYIEKGLKDAGSKADIFWYDDMPSALTMLQHATVAGDVIIIQNDWPDQYV